MQNFQVICTLLGANAVCSLCFKESEHLTELSNGKGSLTNLSLYNLKEIIYQ